MKKIVLLLVISFISSLDILAKPKSGDNLEKVRQAYNYLWGDNGFNVDYNKAFALFSEVDNSAMIPEKDNYLLDAWYGLGVCYYNGYGVEQNYEKAFDNFLKLDMFSASEIIPIAGFYYAECLYNGYGTKKNDERAKKAYFESAMYGSIASRQQLGVFMLNNVTEIVNPDKDGGRIINWMKELADKKSIPESQYILAKLYVNGIGCCRDTTLALSYYEKSANAGNPFAGYELVNCFYGNKYSIYKDDLNAFRLNTLFANKDEAYFQYKLALCYEFGQGTEKDINKAMWWYFKSADGFYPDALHVLGDKYYHGNGVEKDYSKAIEYYRHYLNHKFDKEPYSNSMLLRIDSVEAICGEIYYEGGYGITQDYGEAVKFFKKSGSAITAKAARYYAICYKWGYGGLIASPKKFDEWIKKAAELGDETAKQMIQL